MVVRGEQSGQSGNQAQSTRQEKLAAIAAMGKLTMQSRPFTSFRGVAVLLMAAMVTVGVSMPASALIRTTLSFFSVSDLRQGEIGAVGTTFDQDLGQPVTAGYSSCCAAVTAAVAGGAPSQVRRTFGNFDRVSQIYYMGVSTVAAQDHLVLALNEAFSTSLIGREFSAVFNGFSETQIIADLFGQFDQSLTLDQRIAAGDRIQAFQNELFSLNAGFGLTDRFSLTSFSVGTPAGTGFASLTPSAAPEPATWAMTIAGFLMIGSALRRRVASTPSSRAPAGIAQVA